MINGLAGTTDVESPPAFFNDSRCANASVCVDSNDPLLFTCELYHVILLRLVFPNGDFEYISLGDGSASIDTSVGFKGESLDIQEIDNNTRNISLTLSIAHASLLDGREINCDDTTPSKNVTAGCRVCSKFFDRQKPL